MADQQEGEPIIVFSEDIVFKNISGNLPLNQFFSYPLNDDILAYKLYHEGENKSPQEENKKQANSDRNSPKDEKRSEGNSANLNSQATVDPNTIANFHLLYSVFRAFQRITTTDPEPPDTEKNNRLS